jgi:hypothetical protein
LITKKFFSVQLFALNIYPLMSPMEADNGQHNAGTVGFEPETAILRFEVMNAYLPFQECGDDDSEFCYADQ